MHNSFENENSNLIKLGVETFVPKKFLIAYFLSHKGEKVSSIYEKLASDIGVKLSYRTTINQFAENNFVLSKKTIVGLKEPNDDNFEFIVQNNFKTQCVLSAFGLCLPRKIILNRNDKIGNDEFKKYLTSCTFEDIEKKTNPNRLVICGMNMEFAAFTSARKSYLTETKLSSVEMRDMVFMAIEMAGTMTETIKQIPSKNEKKCFEALSKLAIYDFNNQLQSFADIQKLSIEKALFYFGENLPQLINTLKYFLSDVSNNICQQIYNYFNGLKPIHLDVLNRRSEETLESIAQTYGLSRERIRQIERRQLINFKNFFDEKLCSGNRVCLFDIATCKEVFLISSLEKQLGEGYKAFENAISKIELPAPCKYCKEIEGIFNHEDNYNFFVAVVEETFGDFTKISDVENKINHCVNLLREIHISKETIKQYFENTRQIKGPLYVKNGLHTISKREKLEKIIKDHFVDGFHPNDENDLEKVIEVSNEIYGEPIVCKNDEHRVRNLKSYIENSKVLQLVDRGTYTHISNSLRISNELVRKITTILNKNNKPIAYGTFFEMFKVECEKLNINNRFALQGCLNAYKDILFKAKRDYVKPLTLNSTHKEEILKWLESQKTLFTYEDFEKEFRGVRESVFLNAVYQSNKFVNYWNSGYISVESLEINEEVKAKLKTSLEHIISLSEVGCCSDEQLFTYLCTNMPEFIQKSKATYPCHIFNIFEFLFRDEYSFHKPLIGHLDCQFSNAFELTDIYSENKNFINLNELRDYLDNKLGTVSTNNYVSISRIIDYKSNEYMLVSSSTMIKKQLVHIKNEELNALSKELSMFITNNNSDSIDSFVKECSLKEIAGREINKYLIYGIVSSYLGNQFILSTNDSPFRNGDLRIKNRF